jgi:hypothetical protein
VPIKASTSREVDALIRDLYAERPLTRDAAVARLTVIGGRAVQKLLGVASDADAPEAARVAALRALEGIGDPRALASSLGILDGASASVRAAAIGVARTFLRSSSHGVEVLDRLTSLALDESAGSDVRAAALRAVAELGAPTVAPLLQRLQGDPDPLVATTARGGNEGAPSPEQLIARAAAGDPGDDADALRRAIARAGAGTSVTTLHSMIDQIVAKERTAVGKAMHWAAARGAAHLALAQRGSRLGLYDLRDSLAAAQGTLPLEFLNALSLVGDASCLEPIAAAYGRSAAADDVWRRGLQQAFASIVERHQITRRHAVLKKIAQRRPELFQ